MPTQSLLRLLLLLISDENRVGNSLFQIWKLRSSHKANFGFDFDFEHFGQYFEIEVQARFQS